MLKMGILKLIEVGMLVISGPYKSTNLGLVTLGNVLILLLDLPDPPLHRPLHSISFFFFFYLIAFVWLLDLLDQSSSFLILNCSVFLQFVFWLCILGKFLNFMFQSFSCLSSYPFLSLLFLFEWAQHLLPDVTVVKIFSSTQIPEKTLPDLAFRYKAGFRCLR